MPASTLTPPKTDAPEARLPRVRLAITAVIVAGWVVWLAWLTYQTANPPVVNRVQILNSDLVLVGRWQDRAAGKLDVIRELKHGEFTGELIVLNVPPPRGSANADAEWIVPVRRTKNAYSITAGKFLNRPEKDGKAVAQEVDVAPQIYPATPDVLKQLEDILPAAGVAEPRK